MEVTSSVLIGVSFLSPFFFGAVTGGGRLTGAFGSYLAASGAFASVTYASLTSSSKTNLGVSVA